MTCVKNFMPCLLALAVAAITLPGCSAQPSIRYSADSSYDEEFDRAAGRPPTPRTLYALASILAGKGQDAQAEYVLRRLIESHPQFLPAYNDLAALCLRSDRFEEARTVLEAGLTRGPDDPVLINNLGMCHLLTRDYTAALEQFERAVERSPRNSRYLANRALAVGLMGDEARALELYRAFLTPTEAEHNLAIIARANDQAAEDFIHAREAQGTNGRTGD
jgi:Flp pilus assembly protein TadD